MTQESIPTSNAPQPLPARQSRWATALVLAVAVAAAAGWYVWRYHMAPTPPRVAMAQLSPAVARSIEAARAEVEKSPRSGAAWGRLGTVLLAHDFHDEARACLARAEELDPRDARWPYLQGLLVQTTDAAAAVPSFQRAVAASSGLAAARLKLGEVLTELNRNEEAAEQFRCVLADDPEEPRALLGMGRLAYDRGDLACSLRYLRRSAARAPHIKATHVLLATVCRRLGDTASAAQEEAQAVSLSDEQSWPDPFVEPLELARVGAAARIRMARRLFLRGRPREAMALLGEVLREEPDSYPARLALADGLARSGEIRQAERVLQEAINLQPGVADGHLELGRLHLVQEQPREAAACFRRATELVPHDGTAFHYLGVALKQAGDRERALAALQTAIRCKPGLAAAHLDLGELLAEMGRLPDATAELEQVLRLDPHDATARRLLDKLRAPQ